MGWNPFKKSSWEELGDEILGTGDKVADVFDEIIDDAKRQIIEVKDDVRENVDKQWKAVRSHIEEQADTVETAVKKFGDDATSQVHEKLKDANESMRAIEKQGLNALHDASKTVKDELEDVGKEIEKGLKKALNAGVPDVLLKAALPTSVSVSGQIIGNGITISYEDSEEAIDQVMEMIRSGKFDVDIMYHVIPDSITISVGVELALIISVDVGADISYNSQEDIKMIVQWFKDNT